ncbi:hypothetical protein R3P38DRAFT_2816308 [Favolaschia claudopus]|uniref:Uncharacterized protein n=1 Tax=Favolaschia claudopus TaxID=2862362 RepID=A0AAV9YZD5_9AGAR
MTVPTARFGALRWADRTETKVSVDGRVGGVRVSKPQEVTWKRRKRNGRHRRGKKRRGERGETFSAEQGSDVLREEKEEGGRSRHNTEKELRTCDPSSSISTRNSFDRGVNAGRRGLKRPVVYEEQVMVSVTSDLRLRAGPWQRGRPSSGGGSDAVSKGIGLVDEEDAPASHYVLGLSLPKGLGGTIGGEWERVEVKGGRQEGVGVTWRDRRVGRGRIGPMRKHDHMTSCVVCSLLFHASLRAVVLHNYKTIAFDYPRDLPDEKGARLGRHLARRPLDGVGFLFVFLAFHFLKSAQESALL